MGKMFADEKMQLNSILSLIFLPVYVMFAVSMSMVFLSLFSNVDIKSSDNGEPVKQDPFSIL